MAFGGGAPQIKKPGILSKLGTFAKSEKGQAAISAMGTAAAKAFSAKKAKKRASPYQKAIMAERAKRPKITPTGI